MYASWEVEYRDPNDISQFDSKAIKKLNKQMSEIFNEPTDVDDSLFIKICENFKEIVRQKETTLTDEEYDINYNLQSKYVIPETLDVLAARESCHPGLTPSKKQYHKEKKEEYTNLLKSDEETLTRLGYVKSKPITEADETVAIQEYTNKSPNSDRMKLFVWRKA